MATTDIQEARDMKALEERVYTVLSRALLAGQLSAGAPLRETALAELFGISRERVRKILQRLGTNRLIELVPNRGASVVTPPMGQARVIYDARRILEGGIVAHLAPTLGEAQLARLREHVAQEASALAAGDRAESVRLSAQFHMILADATDNVFIVQQMHELVSRTAMMVALHDSAAGAHCACDEHRDIFDALVQGDGPAASKAMLAHLSLVETRLRPLDQARSRDAIETLRELWDEALPALSSPATPSAAASPSAR
ncbi:GntR family transcriptional regulator [soil metagenome]